MKFTLDTKSDDITAIITKNISTEKTILINLFFALTIFLIIRKEIIKDNNSTTIPKNLPIIT